MTALLFNWGLVTGSYLLFYTLEIRMYSWMAFLVLGVLLMARELVDENRVTCWIALALYSICGVYTQYFTALPIFAVYVYLAIHMICNRKKAGLLALLLVSLVDVISYLPTMLLFFSALAMILIQRRKYSRRECGYLLMLVLNFIFCIVVSQLIGSLNGHFYSYRYVIYCATIVWLIMAISFPRVSGTAWVAFGVWAVILGMASYADVHTAEYDSTPLMPYTEQFLAEHVEPDAVMVYDHGTMDYLYEYYMPGHEYILLDDLNLEEMKGKTFWFIQSVGGGFSQEQIDQYHLKIDHYTGFGFTSIDTFDFEKVTVPAT